MKLTVVRGRKEAGASACITLMMNGKKMELTDILYEMGLLASCVNAEKFRANSSKEMFECRNGRMVEADFGGFYPFDPENMDVKNLAVNLTHKLECIRKAVVAAYPEVDESVTVKVQI